MKAPTSPPTFIQFLSTIFLLLLLSGCMVASAQTIIFSENFEGNTASWSYLTTTGNGQNYWEVSNGSCSNGSNLLMVRRNNNACTYRNNQAHNIMARRLIDAKGFDNLTLAFDWICNGQAGQDYGSVFYSFNGTIWTAITSGGVNGQYQGTTAWGSQPAYALPAILADTAFYIGFNWVNNNSQGSFPAFGVDNIVVSGMVKPVPPPPPPANTIFSQNFSTGALPTGWTRTDLTGNNAGNWSFNNPGNRTINTPTAANGFAIFDSDQIGQDNKPEHGELITVAFDCSNYAIVNLSLSHYFRFYANSDYRISVSGDNGSTYTTLVFDSTETANAATFTANISAQAAGKSQVRLKFTYRGNWSWWWAVDDILVTGQMTDSTVWTGAASTAWATPGNWSTGAVPSSVTSVLIPANAVRMPTVGANVGAAAFNLTVASGATLTVATDSTQGGNLTITGDLIIEGNINRTGNALVRLSGAGKSISGDFSGGATDHFWSLESGSSYNLNGNLTTYGLRVNPGAVLNLDGHTLSVYAFQQYGNLSLGSGTLEIAGSSIALNNAGFDAGTGTVHFNSGGGAWASKAIVNQTVPSISYHNLQVRTNSGHTVTLGSGGPLVVANDLTILNPGTTGGIATTGASISVLGDLIMGSAATNGVTLNIGHVITGNGTTSSLVMEGNANLNQINITLVSTNQYALNNFEGSTDIKYSVNYNGTGTQMVKPTVYGSLAIAGTGTKWLGDDIVINGNLTLNSATLNTAISMVVEKATTSAPVAVNYLNGGVAANNNVPTLASLIANASSMTVTVPTGMDNYDLTGLRMSVTHTYNADLDVYLASPSGTVYVVSTDNGGSADGYINTLFTDGAALPPTGNALLNGTYRPEGFTFASIVGRPKAGVWTLYVIDDAAGDDGTLTDFRLTLQNPSAYGNIELKGNWNNANGTFTPGNALVTFNGNSTQNISSRSQAFYRLTINNAAGVQLTDDATVTNILTLSNGVVSTGNNRLIMTSTTTGHLAAYGPAAFVNGNLRRYIGFNTATYALPVGNGTTSGSYRLAELQNNLLLGVSYVDASFGNLTNHSDSELAVNENGFEVSRINPAGVWTIEPNNQPTLGSYGIRLHLNGFNGLVDNEFIIVKRNSGSTSGADWGTGGGLLNVLGGLGRMLSDGFALRTGLTSFSEFGIGDGSPGGSSLPIELLSFTAEATSHQQVRLDWVTAMEIENDYFTVERSADGKDFETLETIEGAGNSINTLRYHTYDNLPLDGTSYYRLKQTDFDGTYTYSALRSVSIKEALPETTINVYPNPSNGSFKVEVSGINTATSIQITDIQGRLVYQGAVDAQGDHATLSLYLSQVLQPGYYQLHLVGQIKSAVQKIVVQ